MLLVYKKFESHQFQISLVMKDLVEPDKCIADNACIQQSSWV